MISYMRQVAVCNSVRELMKQSFVQSNAMGIRAKILDIPATESILRAVSLLPNIDTEEQLKDFIIDYILSNLRLTEIQKEQLDLTN